jgi:hypothetical protein
LGEAYIELITVVDEAEAAGSAFGRWVAAGLQSDPGRALGWVARTDRLDDVARRLGLTVSSGSRAGRDGRLLRWRLAGVDEAASEPSLPFFVEWGHGTPLPGRTPLTHPAGAARLAGLKVDGDPERVSDWLGTDSLPVAVRAGSPALTGIVVATDEGEILVGDL